MKLLQTLALLFSALELCLAINISGSVSAIEATGLSSLPLAPDSSVLLNGGSAGKGFIRRDGSFTIPNVPAGQYVLSVLNREYSFPSVFLLVVEDADSPESASVQVRPYTIGRISSDPSTVPTLPYPIQLKAASRLEYYDAPKSFSVMGLIRQNKMILFMAGGLAFAVGMPKLLAYVDPEIMQEVRANQAEMHKNLNSAQNMDIAGSLSKMLAGGADSPAAPSSGSAGTPRKRR